MKFISKKVKRARRHARVRAKISGAATRPRLSVFRSNTNIYAQIIDDEKGQTLVSAASRKSGGATGKAKGQDRAELLGKEIAEKAKVKKITKVVFDRGGFMYQGKVKAVAEAARAGGLQF